jgi:hypothetical protein
VPLSEVLQPATHPTWCRSATLSFTLPVQMLPLTTTSLLCHPPMWYSHQWASLLPVTNVLQLWLSPMCHISANHQYDQVLPLAKPAFKAPPPMPKPVAPPLWLSGQLPANHKHNNDRDTVYNRDYGGGRGGRRRPGKELTPVSRKQQERVHLWILFFISCSKNILKKFDNSWESWKIAV